MHEWSYLWAVVCRLNHVNTFTHGHLHLLFFQPATSGGECQPGFYCPSGSSAMQLCTAGMYCDTTVLAGPFAACDAGYYCPLQSTSPQQEDCPIGHYCPVGTAISDPCRNGTYGPVVRLQSLEECTDCDPGFYCSGTALITPTGPCDQGECLDHTIDGLSLIVLLPNTLLVHAFFHWKTLT